MTETTNTNPNATQDQSVAMLPLADLSLSGLNPRQDVTEAEIAEIAASIRTVGLMQNLAGLRTNDGVEIVAGGRRLRALQAIAAEDKADPATTLIPVIVTTDPAEAQGWASAETIVRRPLHPVDEVRAYASMAETGTPTATIAKAFAVTVRHVAGRLKLAVLPDPILDELRADRITLDVAAAYTVASDAAHALAVFEDLSSSWYADNPTHIRQRLMAEAADATGKLARCVTRAAYEAAGGVVREDLFGGDVYFLDADLLSRLAGEKLAGAASGIEAEGWAWVEHGPDRPDYDVTAKMGRTYPEPVEATEDEAARYDKLAERIEAGDGDKTETAEFDALQARLDAEHWTEAQKAHAGVFLWIGHDGEVQTLHGLIRPEDMDAAVAAGLCRPSHHAARTAKPETKGPYTAALAADLAQVRTGALQAALLDKPDLALDLITFALSHPVYTAGMPLGIVTTDAANAPKGDEGMKLPKDLAGDGMGLPLSAGKAAEAFAAFQRKKPATKAKLLTAHVARILSIGLAGDAANPFAERIAEQAGLDVRAVWTPTESFLKRLTKDQLLAIHQHIMDRPEPSTSLAKQSKKDVVRWLHLIFNGGKHAPALNDAQRARADAWVPEGMIRQNAAEDENDRAVEAAA